MEHEEFQSFVENMRNSMVIELLIDYDVHIERTIEFGSGSRVVRAKIAGYYSTKEPYIPIIVHLN